MTDWNAIKTEYITTTTSYRKLAQKYGVSHVQIGNVGKEEKWVELRRQHLDKTYADTVDAISHQQVDRAKRFQSVADKLLNKIEAMVDSEELLDTKGIRALTAAIKDLKEVQMIRSDADMREQEARIEKLRKDAQREDSNKEITITLEGDLDDYAV